MTIINLQSRAIIEITGFDKKNFLQGLITNDVNKASSRDLIYSCMLNSKGRFLYDFFIFESEDKLLLDCDISRRDDIIKKLNFYKLRSKVEIKKYDELEVFAVFDDENFNADFSFFDPRNKNLGKRLYASKSSVASFKQDESEYHLRRIKLKIPQGEEDLFFEKSIILEYGFDDLNAIDYAKGCYVGQELTARTHYLGEIRKKIFYIKIENPIDVKKGDEISCGKDFVGIILSTLNHENTLHALALIKLSQEQSFDEVKNILEIKGQKIKIES